MAQTVNQEIKKNQAQARRSCPVIDLERGKLRAKDDHNHQCKHCHRTFRHSRNLYTHVKEAHPNELLQEQRERRSNKKEYPHECLVCHHRFKAKSSLRSHKSRKHTQVEVLDDNMEHRSISKEVCHTVCPCKEAIDKHGQEGAADQEDRVLSATSFNSS